MDERTGKKRMGVFSRLGPFWGELRRRRVWRSAIGYAAGVFVVLQLAEIVFPAFGAPEGALRLLVKACFLGFPLVLALAWAFDITSTGIQRTGRSSSNQGPQEAMGSTLPRLALLAVTLVTVGGVGWWTVRDTLTAEPTGGATPSDGSFASASLDESNLQIRSLAVLPLEDFSDEEGGEYFTAGFHEELISQLSQIGAARVVSRTSVVQYDRTGKAMPAIAEDLGVEGVVEGSVLRDGDRVRITVQLIHGPSDRHLWANSYDGTMEDVIGLQRTVAQAITEEIQAELFPDEEFATPETRVAASPNVQDEYLKGRYFLGKATLEAADSAVGHYEAALREDSSFAPAYAGLAAAHIFRSFHGEDSLTSNLLTDPRIADPLAKAFTLDAESPEARAVLLALQGSLDSLPVGVFPDGIQIVEDPEGLLEAELVLTGTEFGRHIQRTVALNGGKRPERVSTTHRLDEARRLQVAAEFHGAEEVVRKTIEDAPESREAWEALEQLRTVQGNFQGVVEAREERLARNPQWEEGRASILDLEERLAAAGEKGYWSWRLQDLQGRREAGEEVSQVKVARAHLGLDRRDEAFQALEDAVFEGDRNLMSLWSDPAWDSVRTDPRFRAVLKEIRKARREEGMKFPDGS